VTTGVRREGGKVWIEGVPAEVMVRGTFHLDGLPAAMRAVLKFKGVDEKYLSDDVFAAITGQPFRFWFAPDWASCLAYTFEEPVPVIVAEVLGFDYTWHRGGDGGADWEDLYEGKRTLDRDVVAAAWQELVGQLDVGNPVILFGGEPEVNPKASPVVVTGYDSGHGLIYFLPHSHYTPAPKWNDADPQCEAGIKEQGYRARRRPDETNWVGNGFAPGQGMGGATICFFAFGKRTRRPTEHQVATAVIGRAVRLGRGRLRDDRRPYRRSGLEAFDLLIECLDQDGEQFEYEGRRVPWAQIGKGHWEYAMGCFAYGGFRKAARGFLRRCADGFGDFTGEQAGHLRAAASAYDESGRHMDALLALFESVGPAGGDEEDPPQDGFAKALSSPDFRKQAADIIRQVRQAEDNALSSLEEVLALASDRQ